MINGRYRNMWPALRVRPPALQSSAELSWVLVRAFAALDAAAPRDIESAKVLALAEQLDLAGRIATRCAATLFDELEADTARELTAQRLRAVAVDRALAAVVDELVAVAKELAVPLLLLKHAALRRRGLVTEGERDARDVDVLVTPRQATQLHACLMARGFTSAAFAPVHHLPTLTRGPGEVVEIHHALWGIRLAHHGGDVDAAALFEASLTEQLPDGSQVPSQALMAAHAVVHGLIQHRSSPASYPSMRTIADLCALNLRGADAEARCRAFLPKPPHATLVHAAVRLSRALADGVPSDDLDDEEHALLSHIVAASRNPGYRRALHFERIFDSETVGDVPRRLWRALPRASRRQPATWAPQRQATQGSVIARTVDLLEDARNYLAFTLRRDRRAK